MMKKLNFIISLLLFSILTFAKSPLDGLVNNSLLQNANISLLVRDVATNTTVCEYHSKNSVVPASTMKLVTTATALELLGADFRFQTRLEVDGRITADGVLNGNLYIRGGGDPTLGSEKLGDTTFLVKWVEAIKNRGIRKINGRVIADAGLFDDEGVNPKWTWEDMGNYYAAGIYGISYLDNTYRLVLRSGSVGNTPIVLRVVPEIINLKIDNRLVSSTISFDSAYFYGAPHSSFRSVTGEIPANRTEFVTKGDIPNPALLLAQHFSDRLIENDVAVRDLPTDSIDRASERTIIYTHDSPPLSEIITETNVRSNNLYAECVFKYLALQNKAVATNAEAVLVIKAFWKSKGLSVDQLFMYDGSGLSPSDAVSAQFFVELLSYMQTRSVNKDVFFRSLPVAGENGTLKSFLLKTPLQGKVHAKSGTISRVKSYAGYIDKKGKQLVFALLINNPNGSSKAVTKKMEEFLLQLSAGVK
ncbi:MAG: D-alanyl-D-alanine carboxypeptidase/D-alanyl-D-alanine-endopeptidase [Paludibacter sp.]|nr:D-alanyl-D-alanine carboxypeptidase/D-alanyl-D-alanine-endopeptidase [Paludibacter sp.]